MTRSRPRRKRNAQIDPIVAELKSRAEAGLWNGRLMTPYFERCRWQSLTLDLVAIYTRDVGHHTSGWFKNPDYQQCYHLSLSFHARDMSPLPKDRVITAAFLDGLFGRHKRWLWCEPPYSRRGKQLDVWHYRLFYCPDWSTPIKPRGEVYSRELTEAGWKSFSEVRAEEREQIDKGGALTSRRKSAILLCSLETRER